MRTSLAKTYAAQFTRLKTPGPLDAASELVNAVCQTFDPHTDYLPPADKANFDIAITGSLEGIGAALRVHDDLIDAVTQHARYVYIFVEVRLIALQVGSAGMVQRIRRIWSQ